MSTLLTALFSVTVITPAEAVKMFYSGAMLAIAVFKAAKTGGGKKIIAVILPKKVRPYSGELFLQRNQEDRKSGWPEKRASSYTYFAELTYALG